MLQDFLAYIERDGLPEVPIQKRHVELNGFELDVARVLDERGVPYRPQHGVSGFFLDIALLHHDRQGRFVLAVETDGDRYHRSERPATETVSAGNTWNGSAGSFTDLVQ